MPLRSPRYLNKADFYAQAEYCGIPRTPKQVEYSERSSNTGGAEGKVGIYGIGGSATTTKVVEVQHTYTLENSDKVTFSKTLDQMEKENQGFTVLPLGDGTQEDHWTTWRDAFVKVDGKLSLSPVSAVGKIMDAFRQLLAREDVDLEALARISRGECTEENPSGIMSDSQIYSVLKSVYFGNSLPDIPLLYRMTPDIQGVFDHLFISCTPGHFIGKGIAGSDALEGDATVLGTVRNLIPDDPDEGYLSTERWTLHGWDPTVRSRMRPSMDDLSETLLPTLDPSWQNHEDESFFLKGPTLVIDAVAIY